MLRAAWRLLRIAMHVLHGALIVRFAFPRLDPAARQARIRWWARGLLRAAGVGLRSSGAPAAGGTLLVINHVSWLDIVAVHAVCPAARFVSKSDVKHWPLLNRLVDAAGTLYIERERRRDAMRVVHHMGEALAEGDIVAVFPEGTTGEGPVLLPFHANLLQAAIATSAPVQPVALRFRDAASAHSDAVVFVGDTTLVESLWRVVRGDGLCAEVGFLETVPSAGMQRRELADVLETAIQSALSSEV